MLRTKLRQILRKTPLAWYQVRREKTRLAIAVAGITFADVLMFVQLGLNYGLYESAAKLHNTLQADLFLISPTSEAVFTLKSFLRKRLYQAAEIDGVQSITSLYISRAEWRNPERRERKRDILTIGINPAKLVLNLPGVNQHLDEIKRLDRVLFDESSRPEFGDIASLFHKSYPLSVQVNSKRLWVVGLFKLGVSFGSDGTMIASESTFLHLFPQRDPEQIDVGLITLKPGLNLKKVQAQLQATLPSDVLVLTQEQFGEREKKYWSSSTPTGFIFGLGTIIGFVVGIVIVYQILYSDVSDHLPEYATLKAMGYGDAYLIGVLLQESLILAVLGFLPGFVLSIGLYFIAQMATLLPIGMTASRALLILFLNIIMCSLSGGIAMRKLQAADPADIF